MNESLLKLIFEIKRFLRVHRPTGSSIFFRAMYMKTRTLISSSILNIIATRLKNNIENNSTREGTFYQSE